jgi:hypothetical protein
MAISKVLDLFVRLNSSSEPDPSVVGSSCRTTDVVSDLRDSGRVDASAVGL